MEMETSEMEMQASIVASTQEISEQPIQEVAQDGELFDLRLNGSVVDLGYLERREDL